MFVIETGAGFQHFRFVNLYPSFVEAEAVRRAVQSLVDNFAKRDGFFLRHAPEVRQSGDFATGPEWQVLARFSVPIKEQP